MHDEKVFLHKTPQILSPLLDSPPRIVVAGAYYAPKGRDFPPHRDTVWELHYYRQGHIECVIDGDRYKSQPGMMTLVPPNTLHGEIAWTDYANFYIHIDAPIDYGFPRVMFDDADESVMHVCAAIVREQKMPESPEKQLMLNILSMQLQVLLPRLRCNRQHEHGCNTVDLVRRVAAILDERYSTSITIEQIASEIGISKSYLREQFKAVRGMTPIAYLHETRLRHALALLRNTNRTLESVAISCGYDSASHLSRHVKRFMGKSPGALRIQTA